MVGDVRELVFVVAWFVRVWSLVLGGFKCIWECWLFVVFIVWGRRKLVCFVDSYDVNVEAVCMLYRTDVLLYQVVKI